MDRNARARIRRATSDDARGILHCLRVAFERYRSEYTRDGFEDTVLSPGTISGRLASMSVFVAVGEAGDIIGTVGAGIVGGEGHIRGMAVHPEFQGSGVAGRLLAAAEDELRARGCHRITLDTTAPLKRAIRFYEKNGYRPSGKVADFFGMPLYEYVKEIP